MCFATVTIIRDSKTPLMVPHSNSLALTRRKRVGANYFQALVVRVLCALFGMDIKSSLRLALSAAMAAMVVGCGGGGGGGSPASGGGTPVTQQQITVTKSGTGGGTVTSAPAGVDCGGTCSANFDDGTAVTLTATAAGGSVFAVWGGACSGNAATATVTMSAARTCTATFNLAAGPVRFSLGVAKSGIGSGSVSSMPAGIDCGATCSATFVDGTVVTLTASAAPGSTFAGWGGACSGAAAAVAVTMSAARGCTVNFNGILSTTQMGGARQGATLALAGTVTTLAGTPVNQNGTGPAASFHQPGTLAIAGGTLYVPDASGDGLVRKIDTATGTVTPFASMAFLVGIFGSSGSATGMTTDGSSFFVTQNALCTIKQISIADGVVSNIAGNTAPVAACGSVDGIGDAARFNWPEAIASDGTHLYVADRLNHAIRRITIATRVVSTFAGTMPAAGSADGVGAAARFSQPNGIVLVGAHLYVVDGGNRTIRRIAIATGEVTTLAGSPAAGGTGNVDGIGSAARFHAPRGITSDGANLYVTDAGTMTVRKIVIATGEVSTLAGQAGVAGSDDGTGTAARFRTPFGIATDGLSLFVSDQAANTIRKIAPSSGSLGSMTSANAVVSTLAGTPSGADGIGAAARFNSPNGLTSDGASLYLLGGSCEVRRIDVATRAVTTLAGAAFQCGHVDATGAAAGFTGLALTTDGTHLYVAGGHTIRRVVIATGTVSTIAGTNGSLGSADGIGAAARFSVIQGVTTDGTNVYVADSNNHTIRRIVIATGAVSTLAGTAGVSGSTDGIGAAARFSMPAGITTDGVNLYVADTLNSRIRKIVLATSVVTTLAGSAPGIADGVGTAAAFVFPSGITTDGASLYVADTNVQTIRKITPTSGTLANIGNTTASVTTIAGAAPTNGLLGDIVDGTGATARFRFPGGITTDGSRLFIVDEGGNVVRAMQ